MTKDEIEQTVREGKSLHGAEALLWLWELAPGGRKK